MELVTKDFDGELAKLLAAGFRIDVIYPADEPQVAELSRGEEQMRLSKAGAPALSQVLPPFEPAFLITRSTEVSAAGRAGMLYRDLIPGRLGGRYIASLITIPDGGPVDDWVHYHHVAVQIITVRAGWVRVVYEGQGEPFVMKPGDLVLQPPGIRHRVLESSDGLKVIEISAPALHKTFADHEMALPTSVDEADRLFGGQRFLRHIAAATPWAPYLGAEAQETQIAQATGGLADVRTVRPAGASQISFEPTNGELIFGFVLAGDAALDGQALTSSDALVIPPDRNWVLTELSSDFRLLLVTTARLDAAT